MIERRRLEPGSFELIQRNVSLVLVCLTEILFVVPHAHAAPTNMSLDGSWSICSLRHQCYQSNDNASLTTTQANDVIVLIAQVKGDGNTVRSVSDAEHHVWTLRAAIPLIWEYYAIAEKPLISDKINVTWQYPNPSADAISFIVFAVSGANVHAPWAPNFPVERTSWNGSSVPFAPAAGLGNFVIVSTAVNDAPPCYRTTNISPFRTIGEIGEGIYGEADYLLTGVGSPHTVSFSCDPYSDPMTFLADDLRASGS